MSPDDTLTIVLPVKGRTRFTVRWLAYAEHVRLPFRVLIADGSADDAVAAALSDRAQQGHVDCEHVRYPHDATYADYHAKIADALTRVRTPYVALVDDDDFLLVDGVREAVAFLDAQPGYVTCGGQCARFWVGAPAAGPAAGEALYGRDVAWKCSLDTQSVTAETARERLRQQSLRATYPIYYHVHRTPVLREQFHTVRRINPGDLFLIEYLLSCLSAIAGKTQQLESLYIARQQNTIESAGTAHEERAGDWLGRMFAPSWSSDFSNFVEATSGALAAADGIPRDEARAWIVETYRRLVAPALLGDVLKDARVSAPAIAALGVARRLLQRPPESRLRRLGRAVYRRARWMSTDVVQGTEVRAHGVAHADESLAVIREFLRHAPAAAPAETSAGDRPLRGAARVEPSRTRRQSG